MEGEEGGGEVEGVGAGAFGEGLEVVVEAFEGPGLGEEAAFEEREGAELSEDVSEGVWELVFV